MMRFGAVCNQFPLTHFISTQPIELTVKHFGELHCAFFFWNYSILNVFVVIRNVFYYEVKKINLIV